MALTANIENITKEIRTDLQQGDVHNNTVGGKSITDDRDGLPRDELRSKVLNHDQEILEQSNDAEDGLKRGLDIEKKHFTLNDETQPRSEVAAKVNAVLLNGAKTPELNSNTTIPADKPEKAELKTNGGALQIKQSNSAEQIDDIDSSEKESSKIVDKVLSVTEPFPTTPISGIVRRISNRDSVARQNSTPALGKKSVEKGNSVSSNEPRPQGSTSGLSTSSKYKLYRKQSEKEVLVGTPVKEGHSNYMMMYDMLTGIRISVSRCYAKQHREIVPSDYTAAHKLAFDVTGNELTPSSKYDFKFKDYCPYVFRMIRDIFHVDAADYLVSLTGKYVLSELASAGKSGSFFYYSQDYRFIIKTIHASEHQFILKVLKYYYEHIRNNPHTLLSRIFGLHRVKLPGKSKIHFVVMGNVFPPNKDIHEIYDLKGSLKGREISEEEARNPRSVMKDLNWLRKEKRLQLGPTKRGLLQNQLQTDVDFLMDHKIMDYSLLVGIHDINRGNADRIRDNTLSVFEPNLRTLNRRATATTRNLKHTIGKDVFVKSDLRQLGPSTSKLPDQAPPERRYCIFYVDEGGFQSTDSKDLPGKELYFIGLIDIFTYYNAAKRIETIWRTLGDSKKTFSAVHPTDYGERFLKFMYEQVLSNDDDPPKKEAPIEGPPTPTAAEVLVINDETEAVANKEIDPVLNTESKAV